MPTKIHILQTGHVQIKAAQVRARGSGLTRMYYGFCDREWSPWLPIYAYLIEHDEGLILVDTGETARVAEPGYFATLHPYYRYAVRFDVKPEDEIGPQLRKAGFDPASISTVVMAHMHTDHAGGLSYFPKARILVSDTEWKASTGLIPWLLGYPNNRWPTWLAPEFLTFAATAGDLLANSLPITGDGTIRAVPTPGHTKGHLSVSVEADGVLYLIAGDVSYLQETLLEGVPDGLGANPAAEITTMTAIKALAAKRPLVYLNGHDPGCPQRLLSRAILA